MRSVTDRRSFENRFAATISKSLYAVWVNAPRPFTSPSAHTPSTLVRSSSSTSICPRFVRFDAGCVETEVVGVRYAAYGE